MADDPTPEPDPTPTPAPEPDPEPGDPEPEPDPDPEPEPEVPSAAEWRRTQLALARANDEAKRHRLEAKRLAGEAAKAAKEGEDAAATALREAREEATREAEGRYKPLVVRSEASAALVAAGAAVTDKDGKVAADRLARLLRLVNLDEVDVSDDGVISGLDDQVASIKADYPELFAGPKPPPRPKADGADRKPEPVKPKTSAERLAASLGG